MKTELKLQPHALVDGAEVIEVWFNGKFIATVTGADHGPGIRIVGRHQLKIKPIIGDGFSANVDDTVKITEISLL